MKYEEVAMNLQATETYRRASMLERAEGILRALACLAAASIAACAVYGSIVVPTWPVRSLSVLLVLIHTAPLAMRGVGWRNRTHPRHIWLRSLAAPFYLWILHLVRREPLPAFALVAGATVIAVTAIGGYLIERK